jgi:RNA methyltransferase, TrmH family
MWSIENSEAVGSAGWADALRLLTFQNLTPQFVSEERLTVSYSDEGSSSFRIPLSTNSARLNRQTPELEHLATHGKQTTAVCSNRQKIKFCKTEKSSATGTAAREFQQISNRNCLANRNRRDSLKIKDRDISNRDQNRMSACSSRALLAKRPARLDEGTKSLMRRAIKLSQLLHSEFEIRIPQRARAISQQVYASSGVCYACCMAPQFPSDKRAQTAPESVPVRAQSNQSGASARAGNADSISSRDNKWLKQFRAALRGTGPAAGEPIAAEGPKLVEEGVRSGLETEALLVSEAGERHLQRILQVASESDSGIPRSRIFRTTDKLFESVAGTEAPQGVAALFRQPEWSFDDVMRGRANLAGAFSSDSPLIVVMAAVQDPGNVGTIVRSAEAFGASGVVSTRGAADPWSPKALRASAGSALRLPLLRGMAIPIFLAQLRVAGVSILAAGTRPTAATTKDTAAAISDLRGPCAVFIGNEGAGLPSEVEHAADDWISIAMNEGVESLNAGIAASVILFEAARQRRGA